MNPENISEFLRSLLFANLSPEQPFDRSLFFPQSVGYFPLFTTKYAFPPDGSE